MQKGKIDYSIDSHYHSDYLNDVVKILFSDFSNLVLMALIIFIRYTQLYLDTILI